MMGAKKIWDGRQLPEVGDEVLIHLASSNSWERRTVSGFKIWPHLDGDRAYHRIFVNVFYTQDGQKIPNARLLNEIRPIFWREGDDYNPADEGGEHG